MATQKNPLETTLEEPEEPEELEEKQEIDQPTGNREGQLISIQQAFFGPIPSPHQLKQYDKIQPGFAERIVHMAETEQQHRHWVDEHNVKNQEAVTASLDNKMRQEISMAKVGQFLVFMVILLSLLIAFFLAWKGYSWYMVALFTGLPVASVLMTLYPNMKNKPKENNSNDSD